MPKISNLTINSTSGRVGLFGETGANAHIESVGIANAKVSVTSSSQADIDALAGSNAGKIIACYSTGAIDTPQAREATPADWLATIPEP